VGGTEIHTYEVARRLVAAGHRVTVLTTDPSGKLPARQEMGGIQVLRVRAWPQNHDYFFAPALYAIIRHGDWDIVHCQGYHTLVAPLAMLAAWRAGIPYVVTFHSGGHSSRLRTALRPLQQWALRPLLQRARKLIGVSDWEADFFQTRLQLPPAQFTVIPNGSQLPPLDECLAPTAEPTILSIGRLERYKGHQTVIAALAHVAEQIPNIRLRIIGAGPYEQELRRLCAAHGVAERVEIGLIAGADRQAMANAITGAALCVLLSNYESQGMAVMEALALGRPVLVADSSSLQELANRGLVRALPLTSHVRTVAEAMVEQLRRPHVASPVDLPTWERCYTDLLQLYTTVVEEAAQPQIVPRPHACPEYH
jgi:glycosyltransferase involved in cell wall biosynthesis